MAESKIKGRSWLLFISEDGGTTYLPVACLTSNNIDSTADTIDANSKCGNETLVGDTMEQTIAAEGFAIIEDGTPSKISESKLYDLHAAKTIINWKMGKAVPVAGDYTYTGDGIITSFSNSSSDGELNTFSIEIAVKNPPATKTVTV